MSSGLSCWYAFSILIPPAPNFRITVLWSSSLKCTVSPVSVYSNVGLTELIARLRSLILIRHITVIKTRSTLSIVISHRVRDFIFLLKICRWLGGAIKSALFGFWLGFFFNYLCDFIYRKQLGIVIVDRSLAYHF